MDPGKHEGEADNHNTNQNEAPAASRASMMTEQFQDPTFLTPENTSCQNLEVNVDIDLKIDTSYNVSVPTITISPASPCNGDMLYDRDDYKTYDHTASEPHQKNIDTDLLCTPPCDTALNTSTPVCDHADVSCGLDANNDEDIEVICRYSSTPIMSNTRDYSMDDTDCSMLSLNNASPIAQADSILNASNLSANQSVPCDVGDEGADKSQASGDQQAQNDIMAQHQFLYQNLGQTMLQRDGAIAQNSQQVYDAGRNMNQCSLPAALILTGACSSTPNVYSTYVPGSGAYNDYFPTRDNSWTDLSYRSDLSPLPPLSSNQADPCCYSMMSGVSTETEYFVYPSIYVSSAGLISVLLRNDMSVEMTVDRTIRVVSHNHMMAVATDSRGTAACLYHPAVKVFQIGTTTDIATQNFRARMGGGDAIVFSNGINFFKLEDSELQPTAPIKFTDILRDQSVNLLFSSEGYGESLVASCMQVAAQAEYANLPKGGVIVRINGVKVTQTGGGDVTVVTGAKFIRLSPHFGTTRLGNRFVDIEVEKDWTVKLTRGSHSFIYSKKRAMVCNGKMEAGFDENNGLKVTNLQPRHPLLAEPSVVRRPVRKPVRVTSSLGTPKRRPGQQGLGRGGGMM